MTEDLITYHTTNMRHAFPGMSAEDTIGTIYTAAFMSSTPLLEAAIVVADDRATNVILRMKINVGQGKGLYINEFSDKIDKEYELLLSRKVKYIVESYEYIKIKGKTYIILTVREE